jgi:hypothetical protein
VTAIGIRVVVYVQLPEMTDGETDASMRLPLSMVLAAGCKVIVAMTTTVSTPVMIADALDLGLLGSGFAWLGVTATFRNLSGI